MLVVEGFDLLVFGGGFGTGRDLPTMISHSGFWTRSESGWGSRRASHFVPSASLISSSVRWRMKTGLPRHLMITWMIYWVNG